MENLFNPFSYNVRLLKKLVAILALPFILKASKSPNFVLVYMDDLGWADTSVEMIAGSKKFTSKKKLLAAAEYIKKNALYWHIGYETEEVIDKINIRNATYSAMHHAIKGVINKQKETVENCSQFYLLVDGNDFKPYTKFNKTDKFIIDIPNICIKGGDNKYTSIAAASILAKVARDKYIEEICSVYPGIDEYYSILSNKGYGSKKHMEGIKNYGITPWHRKSFGICKTFDKVIDEKELR